MRFQPRFKTTALFAAIALLGSAAAAQAPSNEVLKAAAQKAISANPDVTARFNAYRAAANGVDAARGGFYPRLDLSASAGRDRDTITPRSPETQTMNRTGASLTLTQLLWDGLATKNEVGRLGHEKVARYFELLDTTEQTALETTRAYYDVLRYRRLVQLAEDSYVSHRSAFGQIDSRFRAGVGRGVDLEQAGARLALAESNLNTEVSNLHDVSARYQRIVGDAPPKDMPMPVPLKVGVPASATDAAEQAIRRSPTISASIETLRASRSLASAREASYQPTVQARVRTGAGKNFDGVREQTRDSSAEIILNWNLFNGGTDQARIRQQADLVNQAADLRDRACRDVRQTVSIAYNDTRKLIDQLQYLDRNTLAIEKARDAYRQQFDIGQRSLLDLLNSENELYTARRSYANAEYDLNIAYARTHAALNQLGGQLGLMRAAEAPDAPADADRWSAGQDAPGRCPTEVIQSQVIDMAELDRRAGVTTAPAASAQAPGGAASAPVPPRAATPLTQPRMAATTSLPDQRLTAWAAAWQSKDVDRYLGFYAPGFAPAKGGADAWKAERRSALAKPGDVNVTIENVQTRSLPANRAETTFKQTYRSASYNDVTTKTLTWEQINGEWYIVKESGR